MEGERHGDTVRESWRHLKRERQTELETERARESKRALVRKSGSEI